MNTSVNRAKYTTLGKKCKVLNTEKDIFHRKEPKGGYRVSNMTFMCGVFVSAKFPISCRRQ